MSKSTKISVMLSSRCTDQFPIGSSTSLTDTRRELKKEIEQYTIGGKQIFDVWINEDAPPAGHTADSWEACLKEVRACDVLIVIANGNAGWGTTAGDIGICHAEYMEGLGSNQDKVRYIQLPVVKSADPAQSARNQKFAEYVDQRSPFRGGTVKTIADLTERVLQALTDAVVTLTQAGGSASASSRFDTGGALDWSRLDFAKRKAAMERSLTEALTLRPGSSALVGAVAVKIDRRDVAVFCHAVPAALSVAAARELVGRPFLRDHEFAGVLAKAVGPVHIIACHRGATESQATTLLGFADATVVSSAFGIYVADPVQKVQFVFLSNCRDDSQTRHALQRFFNWLEQTEEAKRLAARAASRAAIVKLIAREAAKS